MSISQHIQQREQHSLCYTPSTGVQLWDVTPGLVTYSENRGTDGFRISSATSVLGQSPFLSGEGATVPREAGVGLWEQGPQREPSTSSFQKHFSGSAQCLIGKLREMTGTMPCPKVPQGTHSKPLLPSYRCWLSRVLLALLLSGWEPLLVVDTCLGVTSPAPLQCKAGSDFQHTACPQDSPTAAGTHRAWQSKLASEQGACAGPWPEGCSGGGDAALAGAEDGGSERSRLLLSHCPLSQARGTKCREPQPSGERGWGRVIWKGSRACQRLSGGFSRCGGEGTCGVAVPLPCSLAQ